MTGRAARVGHVERRLLRSGICLAAACFAFAAPAAHGESLPEALTKAYQTNPALNAERARQRATDENVPQALSGYRPQIVATLSAGLQAVRNLLPDNTIQSANLKPWTIGVTVTQTLFNGFKTANSVRVAELQVQSGREALRNVGQGVLLDAVTVYTNVLANQSLVEAQRANVAFLQETLGITQKRLNAGDVTPTDTAQAEARLSRGRADLNAAEVNLAVSQATYSQVIGNAPNSLRPAETVDRLLPRSRDDATGLAFREHPAVMAASFDFDVATTTIRVAESSLMPTITLQGSASRSRQSDPTLSSLRDRPGLGDRPAHPADLRRRHGGLADPAGQGNRQPKAGWCWISSATRPAPPRSAPGSPMKAPRLRSPHPKPKSAPPPSPCRACSGRRPAASVPPSTS